MLVTTDGTIADIPRESYIAAEERVVRELRERGKPFAIILNSAEPNGEAAHRLAEELEVKLPEDDYVNFNGYVLAAVGSIPESLQRVSYSTAAPINSSTFWILPSPSNPSAVSISL